MSPQAHIRKDRSKYFGQIMTFQRKSLPSRIWCGDNGVFTGRYTDKKFFGWLEYMQQAKSTCKFIAVPDSVGNAIETIHKYRYYAWRVKSLGFPVAFVAQDGQESFAMPPEYDALFIGGSTEWKLSSAAEYCIKKAQNQNAWVHVGRVNSIKRIKHFQLLGVDSVDGTSIAFAPDVFYKKFDSALRQPPLMRI